MCVCVCVCGGVNIHIQDIFLLTSNSTGTTTRDLELLPPCILRLLGATSKHLRPRKKVYTAQPNHRKLSVSSTVQSIPRLSRNASLID